MDKGWYSYETIGIAIHNQSSIPCIAFTDDVNLTKEQLLNIFNAMERKGIVAAIRYKGEVYRGKQDVAGS